MQADLLMGVVNSKLCGKNNVNSVGNKDSNKNCGMENESFFEIVSQLAEEPDKKYMDFKEINDSVKEFIEGELSPSLISELVSLLESCEKKVELESLKDDLDVLWGAIQKIMKFNLSNASSLPDHPVINEKMILSSNELPIENTLGDLKEKFESIVMMLCAKGINKDGNNNDNNNILDIQISEEEENEGLVKKISSRIEKGKQSLSEAQKSILSDDDTIEEYEDSSNARQFVNKYRASIENEKNILQSDKTHKYEINISNKEFEEKKIEPLKNSEQKNVDVLKGSIDSFDPKNRVLTEEGHSQKVRFMTTDTKMSVLNESDLNNGSESALKANSNKISSIITEPKTQIRPQVLNQTEIIQQVVEKAKLSLNRDHNEIMIKLKPEILGNIRLNISTENHHVTIKVLADSSTVKEILESNLHHLKIGFINQGLEIGSFDVMVGDEPKDFYKGQSFSGFQRGRRNIAVSRKSALTDIEEENEIINSSLYQDLSGSERIDYYA